MSNEICSVISICIPFLPIVWYIYKTAQPLPWEPKTPPFTPTAQITKGSLLLFVIGLFALALLSLALSPLKETFDALRSAMDIQPSGLGRIIMSYIIGINILAIGLAVIAWFFGPVQYLFKLFKWKQVNIIKPTK